MAKTKMGVIWCDHHRTAEAYGYDVAGLRDFSEKGLCGAELAWTCFFPGKPIPYWLTLLGDYNSWRMRWPEECLPFYEGLKLWNQSPLGEGNVWDCLFQESHVWQKIIEEGKTAAKYRNMYCSELRNAFGFVTEIGGQKAYALNAYRFGSQAFGSMMKEYPVCIAFIYDGKQFTVSLYSETVDVSEIAKQFGGGGHKGAAGFVCDVFPFASLSV
jgi:oligoribonuclease NrnB/cAMP/cGMP phosphodiesterase (DHH superfamily)